MRYTPAMNAAHWFKGNTHIHSTLSDGGKTLKQLGRMYAAKGYDFLFRADHWVASDTRSGEEGAPLLWMDGVELDGTDQAGTYYHVVCLGRFEGIRRELGFEAALAACRAQGGLRVLAHPFWLGLTAPEVERWEFDAVEVYNHVCQWLNGKGDSLVHWHQALARNPRTLALAVDDAHITSKHPGWNGGWIMVNAPECTPAAIVAALRAGNYYSSTGPAFESILCADGRVTVQTSPVRFIRLVGPRDSGRRVGAFRGKLQTGATFDVPSDWPYAYVEIEDARGHRAWSNTL
jgi:hypothetical protein